MASTTTTAPLVACAACGEPYRLTQPGILCRECTSTVAPCEGCDHLTRFPGTADNGFCEVCMPAAGAGWRVRSLVSEGLLDLAREVREHRSMASVLCTSEACGACLPDTLREAIQGAWVAEQRAPWGWQQG